MSDPILPLAVWEEGTLQNDVPANDNALRMEILNGLVISDSTDAQPGSPADGDIYIITGAATGTQWATFDEFDLAIFSGGTWYAYAPSDGVVVNIAGDLYAWDGAAYTSVGGGGGGMTNPMTTAGDIIVGGVAGAPARLAAGSTAGHVLTSNGPGVAPSYQAGGGGGGAATRLVKFYGLGGLASSSAVFTNTSTSARKAISPFGRSSGKYYFAFKILSVGGSGNISFGLAQQDSTDTQMGASGSPAASRGASWGLIVTGGSWNKYSGTATPFTGTAAVNDVIVVYVDLTAGNIWWQINGTVPASGNPATGANPHFNNLAGLCFPGMSCAQTATTPGSIEFDGTSASPFGATIAAGFSPWEV